MIDGLGIDMLDIGRIERLLKRKPAYLIKIFSEEERRLLQEKHFAAESVAGRFAAKEACLKALGLPMNLRRMKEIQILGLGKPEAQFRAECLEQLGERTLHLSISHEKHYAIAIAILEG